MADDDDFAFDFEGNLQKEAETYQGASVSGEGDFLLLRVSLSLSLSVRQRSQCLLSFSLTLLSLPPSLFQLTPETNRRDPEDPSRTWPRERSWDSRSPTSRRTTDR